MMMLSLRRLGGVTRRGPHCRLSQRSAVGPPGALVSRMGAPSRKYPSASPVPGRRSGRFTGWVSGRSVVWVIGLSSLDSVDDAEQGGERHEGEAAGHHQGERVAREVPPGALG